MHAARKTFALLVVALAALPGCAFPFGLGKTGPSVIDPKPANKIDTGKTAATPAAGSPKAESASGKTADAKPVDAKSMADVMAEMQKFGALEPEAAAQLTEDLKKTDPALWQQTVEAFQATLAYRRQMEAKARQAYPETSAQAKGYLQEPIGNPPQNIPLAACPAVDRTPANFRSSAAPPTTTARILPASAATDPNIAATPGMKSQNPNSPAVAGPVANESAMTTMSSVPSASSALPQTALRAEPVGEKFAVEKSEKDKHGDKTPPAPDLWPTAGAGRVSLASRSTQSDEPNLDWREHLDAAVHQLERETAEVPGSSADVNRHVALRMMYLVAGRRDDALRPIPGIGAAQQDFWAKEIYGLSTYLDNQRITDPARRAAEAAWHLQEAVRRLNESGPLSLKNLAFCSEVKSFGVYKKFDKYEFKPDQNVILYAEVQNFKIEASEKGYRTALRSSYQILDSHGNRVAEHEYPVAEEVCQNARSDFFFPLILTLPRRINEGDYTLQLTLEDTLSQKLSQSSITLTIKDAGNPASSDKLNPPR